MPETTARTMSALETGKMDADSADTIVRSDLKAYQGTDLGTLSTDLGAQVRCQGTDVGALSSNGP
eukprot:1838352-Rhodomonas_salina.1